MNTQIMYYKHINATKILLLLYVGCTNRQARDEFQWVAVWQLLYHLQHPACFKRRLQRHNNLMISRIQLARRTGAFASYSRYIARQSGIKLFVIF